MLRLRVSFCETKYVTLEGDVVDGTTYKNAHGFFAFVWEAINERYQLGITGAWERLWKEEAAGSFTLEGFERDVLYFTYDDALIHREDCKVLVQSLRKFVAVHSIIRDWHVCHLAAVADEIECRLKDPSWQALGFYGMSVSEDPWLVYENKDDVSGEVSPYNIFTGTKHWFVQISKEDP